MMRRARLDEDGYLEVERIIDGQNKFVKQLCIHKASYCGPNCPAFQFLNFEFRLHCVANTILIYGKVA